MWLFDTSFTQVSHKISLDLDKDFEPSYRWNGLIQWLSGGFLIGFKTPVVAGGLGAKRQMVSFPRKGQLEWSTFLRPEHSRPWDSRLPELRLVFFGEICRK